MFKGLKSLIAGVVAGTALGLLFSPKKGEEIRKNLKKELKEGGLGVQTLKDTLSKMGNDLADAAVDTYEELSETEGFQKAEKEMKRHATKAKKNATKNYKKAKKEVKKVTKDVKRTARKVKKNANKTVSKVKKQVKKATNTKKK